MKRFKCQAICGRDCMHIHPVGEFIKFDDAVKIAEGCEMPEKLRSANEKIAGLIADLAGIEEAYNEHMERADKMIGNLQEQIAELKAQLASKEVD